MEGHSDIIYGVSIFPNGKKGLSVSRDKTLRVWDLDHVRQSLQPATP